MAIFSDYSDYIVFTLGLLMSFLVTRFFPKKKKSLSFYVTNISHIFEKSKSIESSGLEVRFHGAPVDYVETISLKFLNDGESEIVLSDFFEPIKIVFDTGTIILAIKASRDSLFEVSQYENVIDFKFDLLNPKESITIDFTLNKRSRLKISGRIKGVSSFQPRKKINPINIIVKLMWGLGLLALVFYTFFIAHNFKLPAILFCFLLTIWSIYTLMDIRNDLKGDKYDYAGIINNELNKS